MSPQIQASLSAALPAFPVSRFTIDGIVKDDVVFVQLRISKNANKHDVAEITLLWPTTSAPDIERKTVSFSYGTGATSANFYGYVYATEKSQSFQKQTTTKITCLGVTWHMRTANARMFVDKKGSEIVRTIVEPHQLGVTVAADDDYVIPRISQVRSTDWEMVLEVAHLIGMYTIHDNGVVRLLNAVEELDKKSPWRRYSKSTQLLEPQSASLLDFSPINSVTTNRSYLQPTFSYFTGDGGIKSYTPTTADPVDVATIPDFYIPDPVTADHLIKVMTRWNMVNQSAEARIRGDGSVNPGDTVSIRTGLSDSVVDDYDGMWFVTGVDHEIDSKVFQTNLKLSRDKYRAANAANIQQRYWENNPALRPEVRAVDGKWVSSWR